MEAAQKELFEDIFGDGSGRCVAETESVGYFFKCKCGAEFDEPRQLFNFYMRCPKCGGRDFEVVSARRQK